MDSSLERLVSVVESIRYDTMPEEVRQKAMLCLADFAGVFCGSAATGISKKIRLGLKADLTADAEDLATWMASSARILDLDDGHRFAMAHPGVVINATAIALAVTVPDVSGQKIIEAIVRGYEVYCYQGRVINPGAYLKRGIDATSACGAAAAATVAATMLNFNRRQMADAISLAAAVVGGLNQSAIDGSTQKYLVAGYGAKIGISAANLARHGLGGPTGVFEGTMGFANAFSPSANTELLHNPVLTWDIQDVYLKIHACVRRIHATLDAVDAIVRAEKLSVNDIRAVKVFGGQFLCDAGGYDPKDGTQAQTRVPYAVAVLLKYGTVSHDLMEAGLNNPEIAALSRRVTVCFDPKVAALAEKDKSLWGAARVAVETTAGATFELLKPIPNGDREAPFPMEVIKEKFLRHAAEICTAKQAHALWRNVFQLHNASVPGIWMLDMIKASMAL